MTLRFRLPVLFAAMLLAAGPIARAQSLDVDPQPGAVPDDPNREASPEGGESPLTADLFYRLMLGDVALQRGDVALAARAYIDAARTAGDARLARRATEIAIASRQRSLVTDAAQVWIKLDPTAERPKRVLAALAADGGKGVPNTAADDELRTRIERVLADAALSGSGAGEVFCSSTASSRSNRTSARCCRSCAISRNPIRKRPKRITRLPLPHTRRATTWPLLPRRATRSIVRWS